MWGAGCAVRVKGSGEIKAHSSKLNRLINLINKKTEIIMSEQEIYEKFIDWLGKTWWGLPDSDRLMPIMKSRYTVEEAEFLTGMPFHGLSLEELATAKGRDPK